MSNLDERLHDSAGALRQSLEGIPAASFDPRRSSPRPAVVITLLIAASIAVTTWVAGSDVAPSLPAAESPTVEYLDRVAELDDLVILDATLLDGGTLVARAQKPGPDGAAPAHGFARSEDGGTSWTFTATEEHLGRAGVQVASIGEVVVGDVWEASTGRVSVVVSTDRGITWRLLDLPVPDGYGATGLASSVFSGPDGFLIYGGTGVWRSTDAVEWTAGTVDTLGRIYDPYPRLIDDTLVAVGVDGRIYADQGSGLELVVDRVGDRVSLTGGPAEVVAWDRTAPDGETWIATSSDGLTWSERSTRAGIDALIPLSESLGGGYVAAEVDEDAAQVAIRRSSDLEEWVDVAVLAVAPQTVSVSLLETADGVIVTGPNGGDSTDVWRVESRLLRGG